MRSVSCQEGEPRHSLGLRERPSPSARPRAPVRLDPGSGLVAAHGRPGVSGLMGFKPLPGYQRKSMRSTRPERRATWGRGARQAVGR